MKLSKRLLSLLLTVCMLAGMPIVVGNVSAAAAPELTSVAVTNDTTLAINFSTATIDNNGGAFCAIRLVDNTTDWNLQWDGDVPLQWAGYMDYPNGYPSTPMSFTMNASTLGVSTISGILALIQPGAKYAGMTATFCFEESAGSEQNGTMSNYYELGNPANPLKANRPGNATNGRDGAYVVIPGGEAVTRLSGVTKIDTMNYSLQFSGPVTYAGGSFASIRLVNNMTAQDLQWDGSNPLQWSGDLAADPNDNTKLIWTLHAGHSLTIDQVLEKVGSSGQYRGLYATLSIEETGDCTQGNTRIENITGADGKGVLATRKGGLDGIYFELAYTPRGITLDKVVQVGQNKLSLKFSKPVANDGNCFCAIRIVDNATNQNLQWKDGTPLQWGGGMAYGDTHDYMVWTMGGDTLGITTIDGIKALVAEGGEFEGCEVMFCMEETNGSGRAIGGNGLIDTYWDYSVSEFTYAPAAEKLAATRVVKDQLDGLYIPISEAFTLDNAYIYNDKQIILDFSEKFDNFGGYWASIRIVDNITDQNLQWSGATPLQWQYGLTSYYGSFNTETGDKLIGTISDTNTKFSDIVAFRNANCPGCPIMVSIEEGGAGVVGSTWLVENFTSLVSGNKLMATHTAGDGAYVEPTVVSDSITVTKAEAISESIVEVTFSEPVVFDKYLTDKSGYKALRIVDEDNNLTWTGMPDASTPLQWTGDWAATSDPAVYRFTIKYGPEASGALSVVGVNEIAALVAEGGTYAGKKLTFCIEQQLNDVSANIAGVVDNVTSLDGVKKLAATNNGWDGSYTPVTMSFDPVVLSLTDLTAINDIQIVLTFSEPVTIDGNVWSSMRMVDASNGLIWDGAVASSTPMQWAGALDYYNEDHSQLIWTMYGANTYGIGNLSQLLNYEGIENFKTNALKFCFEEIPGAANYTEGNLRVDNIVAADGVRTLKGNTKGGRDGLYLPVTVGYDQTPLEAISADVLDDTSLVVTFSEPVTITGSPFMALRYVNAAGELMWTGEENASTPLQWGGNYAYYNEEHTKIVWYMAGSQYGNPKNIGEVLTFAGDLSAYKDTANVRFCIEESSDGTSVNDNGLVQNITNSKGKQLNGYAYHVGYLDGIYLGVLGRTDFGNLTIESVTTASDTDLIIKFSAPVSFGTAPFMAIRMVDETGTLYWDGGEWEKGVAMQWTGNWTWNNDEHTEIRWTMNGGNTYGANNLTEVLTYAGDLAKFKDYAYKFCIEELPPVASFDNHISNITLASDGAVHLQANKRGSYDGQYDDINVTYAINRPLVMSAKAINDRQVLISFSAPVRMNGNPFIALRLITGSGDIVWSNKENVSTPIQFYGTWDWANSAHTQILWTMNGWNTIGACSITDVVNFAGGLKLYEGYRLRVVIEELPEGIISFNDLVENIVTADGRHLTASKSGGYDGAYCPLSVDFDTTPIRITSVKSPDEKTIIVDFSAPVTIDDKVKMGLTYVDYEGQLAVGIDAKSVRFNGDWEWTNDDHTQIKWTLADENYGDPTSILDILTYKGDLKFNSDCVARFYIEERGVEGDGYNKLITNIRNADGTVELEGTKLAENDRFYGEIETAYEVPVQALEGEDVKPEETVKYVTDYKFAYIGGGAMLAAGVIAGIIIGKTSKKKKEEN